MRDMRHTYHNFRFYVENTPFEFDITATLLTLHDRCFRQLHFCLLDVGNFGHLSIDLDIASPGACFRADAVILTMEDLIRDISAFLAMITPSPKKDATSRSANIYLGLMITRYSRRHDIYSDV